MNAEEMVPLIYEELRRLAHAYLFVGPSGTGKLAAARGFAAGLLCAASPPDGTCESCRRALAPYKVPAMIKIVPSLEVSAAGKLVRPGA